MQETIHTKNRKDQQPLLEGLPNKRGRKAKCSERENFPSPVDFSFSSPETLDLEEMADQPPPRRTLGDVVNTVGPMHYNSIALPADDATNMVVSPTLIQLVQSNQFHGLSNENPYDHLTTFSEICNTVRMNGVSEDKIKVSLFPFSRRKHKNMVAFFSCRHIQNMGSSGNKVCEQILPTSKN